MVIVPTVNCKDLECLKKNIRICAGFLPVGGLVQIDIGDGLLGAVKTWNDPGELKSFLENDRIEFDFEIHLMVEDPEKSIVEWSENFVPQIKRFVLHWEAVKTGNFDFSSVMKTGAETGIAFGPKIPSAEISAAVSELKEKRGIDFFQILAVPPGASGQQFDQGSLNKIREIKKIFPDIIIEVDGGINPENGKLCKEAGADILCSGAFVLQSPDPAESYKKLVSL